MRLDALPLITLFIHCALAINGQQEYKMYTSRPDCGLSNNKGLQGNTTIIVLAENDIHCARKCNAEDKCASLNYNAKNHTCQLNWGLAGENCESVTDMPGYRYYQKVDERCSHHGVWINETCGCRCETPYFGKLCERKYQENVIARPHGNPPVNYWRNLEDFFNLLTGMPFPLDGTVVGWVYYMGTVPAPRPFVGIYRPVGGDLFQLLHKTELPYTGHGKHSFLMDCPWHVQQGDVIGLHTIRGRENGIRMAYTAAGTSDTYISFSASSSLRDNALIVGNNYTMKTYSREIRIYAVQALFY